MPQKTQPPPKPKVLMMSPPQGSRFSSCQTPTIDDPPLCFPPPQQPRKHKTVDKGVFTFLWGDDRGVLCFDTLHGMFFFVPHPPPPHPPLFFCQGINFFGVPVYPRDPPPNNLFLSDGNPPTFMMLFKHIFRFFFFSHSGGVIFSPTTTHHSGMFVTFRSPLGGDFLIFCWSNG